MWLDCKSQRLLDMLIKLKDKENMVNFNYSDILSCLKTSDKGSVILMLNHLHKSGHINDFFADNDDGTGWVELSYMGIEYRRFRWIKFAQLLAKSVVIPIIVSFITALVTQLLSNS